MGEPTEEAFLRWSEYAALGTIMQLYGGSGARFPWSTTTAYSPQALATFRRYARLHTDLFPYLYSLAKQAAAHGAPVTRPPGLVFPGHPYEDDFLVGDALFVAPVVSQGATTRAVTLPPGDWPGGWIDWWTGAHASGAVTVNAPVDTLPLWRRADQIVVMLASPVDTLLPSTAPGVQSLADPTLARGIRVIATPTGDATFALYDGSHVEVTLTTAVTVSASAGTRHRDFRFELDYGNAGLPAPTSGNLPQAPDAASLATCAAPGCWRYDPATTTAFIRLVDVGSGATAMLN
jgi:alpha-D-xyloside xylohydrolase